MKEEELKQLIDINKVEYRNIKDRLEGDFIVDNEGEPLLQVSILEFKLIEKIKELEARIEVLENK